MDLREAIVDERLPQMREILNPSRMREVFERELVRVGGSTRALRFEDCQIAGARYRPGRNCLVTYVLKVVEISTGLRREQLLSLLACREGESPSHFTDAKAGHLAPSLLGAGLIHLPQLEAVGWLFPNDRKLTCLPAIVDSAEITNNVLPEVVAGGYGEEWRIVESHGEVVRYVAERACTLRMRLVLRNLHTDALRSLSIFGKTYPFNEGEIAWESLRHIWRSEVTRHGRLLIPRPLIYQPGIKTHWQAGLEGRTLIEEHPASLGFRDSLSKAGTAVAALHLNQAPFAPLVTAGMIVKRLEAAVDLLSRTRPASARQLEALLDRLTASVMNLRERAVVALHGDLHLKNFLITGDQVALIDLDNLCQGDRLQDLGSFVAVLYYQGLLDGRYSHMIGSLGRQFIDSYRASAGVEIDESALNWYIAAALIHERAYRCVTKLKAIRVEILDDLIELARQFSLDV